MTIHVTASAKKAIKQLILPSKCIGIRIRVEDSGCNGLAYAMEWCYAEADDDHVIRQASKRIYIDPKSAIYLHGSDLKYYWKEFEEGFEFTNPNETSKCGCGESFYVA